VPAGPSTGQRLPSLYLAATPAAALLETVFHDVHQSSDRIIYETDNGRLYFDRDGSGGAAKVHFATLNTNLVLNNADFFVF
jgi:Ca2+-binding RTX toxin-like protein